MLHEYLIVQMLSVYYVDNVAVAKAKEQWKISRRNRYNGSCQTVRMHTADPVLNFDPFARHIC